MDEKTMERQLAKAFLAERSEEGFRQMYAHFTPSLYRIALRMCKGHTTTAEDVIQEMWIRAIERISGFSWASTLRTWLTGIVLNCAREQLRDQSKNSPFLDALPETVSSPTLFADELDRFARQDLVQAVEALPVGYREILILHDIEGFTHQSIATILTITPGTSKSQLHRARQALRETLNHKSPRGSK